MIKYYLLLISMISCIKNVEYRRIYYLVNNNNTAQIDKQLIDAFDTIPIATINCSKINCAIFQVKNDEFPALILWNGAGTSYKQLKPPNLQGYKQYLKMKQTHLLAGLRDWLQNQSLIFLDWFFHYFNYHQFQSLYNIYLLIQPIISKITEIFLIFFMQKILQIFNYLIYFTIGLIKIVERMIKQHDYLYKIVIVGSQGVGKSSLFLRFCDDSFIENYFTTIGVDFRFKMIQVDNSFIKLQIWDTAGQQRFRAINSAYYRGAQAILLVYDRTDLQSFKELQEYWLNQVKSKADVDTLIAIIGNKSDHPCLAISQDQANGFTEMVGIAHYAVSAKTGQGVEKMFRGLSQILIANSKMRRPHENNKQKINRNNNEIKKKCCAKVN